MNKRIVIFGAGQVAEVFASYLGDMVAGYVVDREHMTRTYIDGKPVVAFEDVRSRFNPSNHAFLVGMSFRGMNVPRAEKFKAMLDKGYEAVISTSPMSRIWPSKIGRGTMVMDGNTIQAGVDIGENCIIWSGNHIGHHTRIGSHVFIASHAVISGAVEIGDRCFIGVNATIRDGVKIGEGCVIGAGALILKDCEPDGVYGVAATERSAVPASRLRSI